MDYRAAGRKWAASMIEETKGDELEFESLLGTESLLEDSSRGVLVAEGDSWFDYRPLSNRDVLKWLRRKHGYDVREAGPQYGDTLQEMSDDPGQLKRVFECLRDVADEEQEPRALLLSGGGNDIATKEVLAGLLNHKRSGLDPLKQPEVDNFIFVRMKNQLLHWVGAVEEACDELFGKTFPVFVHGYAKPVPDGDAFGWDWIGAFPGPWLKPAFVRKGYWGTDEARVPEEEALAETTPVIGELIDRFNEMLLAVEAEVEQVHHIDVRPVLSNEIPGYKDDWANELHPRKRGFQAVAAAVASRIEDVLT